MHERDRQQRSECARQCRKLGEAFVEDMAADSVSSGSWIEVRDKLPADDLCVLVYVPDEAYQVWIGYVDGDVWRAAEGGIIAPTHWMPFPEPPERLDNTT